MTARRNIQILALFVLPYMFVACGGNSGADNANSTNTSTAHLPANVTKTNAEELRMLINIPYEPEESVWRTDPKQKKLVAVLRFSAADSDKISSESQPFRQSDSIAIPSEPWFPDELIAQGDISGDDTIKGTAYGANLFFQDEFNEGRVTRIEGTNYFVLEMTSK